MTAQEQLEKIFRAVEPLYMLRDQAFSAVTEGLARHGVELLSMQGLDADELKLLKKRFIRDIMPLLSPQIIDSRHPFPHLANKQPHIAVTPEHKRGPQFGLIANARRNGQAGLPGGHGLPVCFAGKPHPLFCQPRIRHL